MHPIETLESRTLFSMTPSPTIMADLSRLSADASAAEAQFQQYGPTLRADLQALRTDARAAGKPVGGVLLAGLNAASLRFFNVTRADALRLFVKDAVAGRVAFLDAIRLALHPGNAVLQAKLTTDVARFSTSTGVLVAKLGADGATLSAAAAAALGAVAAAYPGSAAVANDVAKLQSDGSAFLTALGPSLQAAQADLSQFFSDVAAGA